MLGKTRSRCWTRLCTSGRTGLDWKKKKKSDRHRHFSSWFDEPVDRRFTGSIKYDKYAENRDSASSMHYNDILPMWVADMDLRSPPAVMSALHKRVDHGIFGNSGPDFTVKDAILGYLKSSHNVNARSSDLVFLPGLVVALNLIARVAARKGEAVMTLTPIYPPFMSCAKNAGTLSVAVPLQKVGDTYQFDIEAMEDAVRMCPQRVGVFLLCNPHNPVGKVFSPTELEQVVAFCERHDMVLVSDEVHCDLVLDSQPHVSILNLPQRKEWLEKNTIVLHAPSKTFNVAGACASFAVVPDAQLRGRLKREMAGITADISPFGYAVMKTVYGDPDGSCKEYRTELVQHLAKNVDVLSEYLRQPSSLLKMEHRHQATYLCWLDARELQAKVSEKEGQRVNVAKWLEDVAGLGLNDGNTFGPGKQYDGFVRINLGCPTNTVHEAILRLQRAFDSL